MRVRLLLLLCLFLGGPMLGHSAIPNLSVTRTGTLFFAASDLTTNGVPGLSNGVSRRVVSGLANHSAQGGTLAMVNTQGWVRFYDPPGVEFAAGLATGPEGRVSVTGDSSTDGYQFVTASYAANGTALWTNRHYVPGFGANAHYAAIDAEGNTIVAAGFGPNFNLRNIVTIKYAPNGTALWTNSYNETGTNSHGTVGVATDQSGNVVVGLNTFYAGPNYFTTIKYDASGVPLWTNRHRSAPNRSDVMSTIAVDQSGNTVVTGGDFVTFKYAPDGVLLWTNRINFGNAVSIAFDHSGNTLISGDAWPVGLGRRYATIKYTPNGSALWTNYLAPPQYQGGYVPQVFVDGDNNVLILGGTADADTANTDLTLWKLDREGSILWTNRFFESGNGITPRGAAIDPAGSVSFALPSINNGESDFLLLKFRADGALCCSNRFSSGPFSNDDPQSLAINEAGDVYVSGKSDFGMTTVKYVEHLHYTPPPNFVGTDSFTFVATDAAGNSATNTVNINVTAESLWFNPLRSDLRGTNGTRRLHLDGANGNGPVILSASSDLGAWTPIATNPPVNGAVEFLLPPGGPRQFYRAVQIPGQ